MPLSGWLSLTGRTTGETLAFAVETGVGAGVGVGVGLGTGSSTLSQVHRNLVDVALMHNNKKSNNINVVFMVYIDKQGNKTVKMIWRVQVRELKLIVDVLRDILLQVSMEFQDNGVIRFCAVDPEKMAAVEMEIRPGHDHYTCKETLVFTFYLQSLFKILRGAPKNEEAVLTCFKDNPDDMVVRITGNDAQCFLMHRVSTTETEIVKMASQTCATFTIPGHHFYTTLRDLAAVGKILEIFIDENSRMVFKTQDALGTTAEYVSTQLVDSSVVGVYKPQHFVIKYIEKFCKPGLAENLFISVGLDSAIRFVWNMDFGYLALNVAPLPEKTNL